MLKSPIIIMVRVDSFSFNNITIDGKKYTEDDIIVYWDGEVLERPKSHKFTKDNFHNLLMKEPEIIVVGIGTAGLVKINSSVKDIAKEEGIELIIKSTPEAVKEFNNLVKTKKVIGSFHLTC